jgi:hypothetical protein
MHKFILVIILCLIAFGCKGETRSITHQMWTNDKAVPSVMIAAKDLTPEGKQKLDKEIGNGVVFDSTIDAYVIQVSDEHRWDKVTLKVLATPFTVLADGVQYTVVVAVSNPDLTINILKAILEN